MNSFSSIIVLIVINLLFIIVPLFTNDVGATALPYHDKNNKRFPSKPQVYEYKFHLSKVELAPDGFTKLVSAVNGQYPGPPIQVNRGDRLIVHVVNCLGEPTSMHWHGIFQRGTPWFDGVVGQTQHVIPDKYTFTYDFTIDLQSGSYWYHSHHRGQYMDGVLGPLIVYDEFDKILYGYDEDLIVLITDWYHDNSADLFKWFLSPASKGAEPIPNNALINGKNDYNCDWAAKGSKCVNNSELANFVFKKDCKYRMRVINTSGFSAFVFSIDNHDFEIIEVEGTKTIPYRINQLSINVAQRYSVIVDAKQPISNYWMRVEFQQECLPDEFAYNLTIDNKAIIHYEEASLENPTTNSWTDKVEECVDLEQNKLKPLLPNIPPNCDTRIVYEIEFKEDSNGVNRPYVNGSSYVSDEEYPTLKKVFDGVHEFAKTENIYQIHKKDEVIDVVFINKDDGEHPFHLHGHVFWILGWGEKDEKLVYEKLNTLNPIQRDTSTIPAEGWIALRFIANNPGVWACHCHMEWHLGAGLLVQFVELPEIIKTLNPPKSWWDLFSK
ncbi:hypothetical protein Glove_22g130 [Diversispora epigaea]|uniref:Multicopper oxidase n=1 Tax=Diversispora epigaea TaxID=1348612 RepID=A0A397JR25_9GLOM|nr:hypothetical protein Glove_22g130 [Diversispora epigaea]